MTLKTVAKRLIGQDVEAPPAAETVEAIAAAAAAPALRIRAIYTAAEQFSGNRVRDFSEWDGLNDLLRGLRIRQLVRDGVSEFRASQRATEELEHTREELGRLEAEVGDLQRRLVARCAADRIEWNAQNHARQAALDGQLVAAGLSTTESFFASLQALLPAAAEIREWNTRIERHQPGGQPNPGFVEHPAQYIRTGDLVELAERAVVLHFHIIRVAPDRWR